MKYVLTAAGVLLVVLLAVFYFGPEPAPADANIKQLRQIAELAERTCLSNTQSEQGAKLKLSLDLISTKASSDAGVSRTRKDLRGAAESLSEALKKTENDDIRKCMEPWSEKMLALTNAPS